MSERGRATRAPAASGRPGGTGERRGAAGNPAVPVRVVIADDHVLVLAGIEKLLASEPGFTVVGKATTAAEALALTIALKPDILLLDVSMPGGSGLDVLEEVVAVPGVSVILLTANVSEEDRARAFRQGVRGVLLKDAASEMLFGGIRAVLAGEFWLWRAPATAPPPPPPEPARQKRGLRRALTPREREVLAALIEGCTNRDIAERLLISEDTVKHHLTNLFDKTGASTRVELALFAVHRRLLDE